MSLNLIPPTVVLDGASLGASLVSDPVHVMYSDNIGIQFIWTGTPTGTFGISVSNTATLLPNGSITGGTFTPLTLTTPDLPALSGSAGNGYIDLNQISAAFIQITYTRVSGTGSVTAVLTAKPV